MSGPSRRTSPNCVKILPTLFADEDVPENGAAAETVDKGHGRIEKRSLRASTGLNDYLDWPYGNRSSRLSGALNTSRKARQPMRESTV